MKIFNIAMLCLLSFVFSACTMQKRDMNASDATPQIFDENQLGAGVVPGMPIGGSIASAMDENDHTKLNHALDKAPGNRTTWTNTHSRTEYTVTPTRKTVVHGNHLCRKYEVTALHDGNEQTMYGVACIDADGAWSEVGS